MAKIEQLELRNFFGPANVIPCTRCNQPCKVMPDTDPRARLLKHATQTDMDGLCPNCAVASFISSVETLMYGIEKNGLEMLRDPRVQVSFAGVMQAGFADMQPAEIDWERVIANWDLPFPKNRKQRTRGK